MWCKTYGQTASCLDFVEFNETVGMCRTLPANSNIQVRLAARNYDASLIDAVALGETFRREIVG